jgi:hypothetical protein
MGRAASGTFLVPRRRMPGDEARGRAETHRGNQRQHVRNFGPRETQ